MKHSTVVSIPGRASRSQRQIRWLLLGARTFGGDLPCGFGVNRKWTPRYDRDMHDLVQRGLLVMERHTGGHKNGRKRVGSYTTTLVTTTAGLDYLKTRKKLQPGATTSR